MEYKSYIQRRKANWIGHILRRNCFLHDGIERQMTEVRVVGRRSTQLFDDVRNRTYWKLKNEKSENERLSHEHRKNYKLSSTSPWTS